MQSIWKHFVWILAIFLSPYLIKGQVAAVKFIVKVPLKTSVEKDVYISGTFNNWHVKDSLYKMHRAADGTYVITLPLFDKMHYEYKYTLGNWNNVETAANDSAIHNRQLFSAEGMILNDTVANWKEPPPPNIAPSPQMQHINSMKDSTLASIKPMLTDMLSLLRSYVNNWLRNKPSAHIQRQLDRKAGKKLNHAYQQVTRLFWNVMATLTPDQKAALQKIIDSPAGKTDFLNVFQGGLQKVVNGQK